MAVHLVLHAVVLAFMLEVTQPAAVNSVRVTAGEAAVRLNPAPESPVIATFTAGTILEVTAKERVTEWYGVVLPADAGGLRRYGYVAASLVEPFTQDLPGQPPTDSRASPQASGAPDPAQLALSDVPFAKEGLYVGIRYADNSPRGGGDFDGLHFVAYAEELIAVPQLDRGAGPAVLIGYRMTSGAIELAYLRSTHSSVWAGLLATVHSHTLDIDGKYHFLWSGRVQPYVVGGFGFSWLRMDDGVIPFSTRGGSGDGTLAGVGLNGGAGMVVYPHPRVALSGGATYRFDVYTRAKRATYEWTDIDQAFTGRVLRIQGGLTFTF